MITVLDECVCVCVCARTRVHMCALILVTLYFVGC